MSCRGGLLLRRSVTKQDTRNLFHKRWASTNPIKPSEPGINASQSRIERINARLPRFLRPYTTPLLSAPVSHITSFLILHELTAIIPLIGLATTFHYTDYLPPYISDSAWVKEGIEKFDRYFRRKGWFQEGDDAAGRERLEGGSVDGNWSVSEGGVKVVVEVATAWAITKALLPVRLVGSVWATPWFARAIVLPTTRLIGKVYKSGT